MVLLAIFILSARYCRAHFDVDIYNFIGIADLFRGGAQRGWSELGALPTPVSVVPDVS